MKYVVEPIGAQFSNKDVESLTTLLNNRAAEGYRLHSVFQVTQPGGCLGNSPTITNLAVYEKVESSTAGYR